MTCAGFNNDDFINAITNFATNGAFAGLDLVPGNFGNTIRAGLNGTEMPSVSGFDFHASLQARWGGSLWSIKGWFENLSDSGALDPLFERYQDDDEGLGSSSGDFGGSHCPENPDGSPGDARFPLLGPNGLPLAFPDGTPAYIGPDGNIVPPPPGLDFSGFGPIELPGGTPVDVPGGNGQMRRSDPLILDLDGDGLGLTHPDDNNAFFDIDADGLNESVGWIDGDDGILFLDLNGDGVANDITELFGSELEDGYTALAAFDQNGDGVIDNQDAIFEDIQVWIDANQDGLSVADEIVTLADLGVISISLDVILDGSVDNGNQIYGSSFATLADGTTIDTASVFLLTDQQRISSPPEDDTILSVEVMFLPNIAGRGDVRGLQHVMEENATLREMVRDLVDLSANGLSSGQLLSLTESIMREWTGASSDLKLVEALQGVDYAAVIGPNGLTARQIQFLDTFIEDEVEALAIRLASQLASSHNLLTILETGEAHVGHPLSALRGFMYIGATDAFEVDFAGIYESARSNNSSGNALEALSNLPELVSWTLQESFDGDSAELLQAFQGSLVGQSGSGLLAASIQYMTGERSAADEIIGDASNELIEGTDEADVFRGEGGDDTIVGGDGNDLYFYTRGDGHDIYNDGNNGDGNADHVELINVAFSEVSAIRDGNDLILIIAESAVGARDDGSIRLVSNALVGSEYGIESVGFSDGVQLNSTEVRQLYINTVLSDGDDDLVGFADDNVFEGGLGDDSIFGDDGNDTYIYSRGDGNDTIFEAAYDGLSDRLELTDITSSEVTVSREGNDLILIIAESAVGAGDGGSIRLGDTARVGAEYGVETVAFADGIELTNAQLHELYIETSQTDGDDNFAGFTSDNVFEGGLGDDSIFGDDGNDTYIYSRGDGNDTIFEAAYDGLSDRLELTDITSSEVTVSREGNDLILIIAESAVGAGDGGSIRLGDTARVGAEYGVETVAFADGIELTNAQLHELYIETSQTDGDDNFAGFTSDNVFEGGLGDDSIFGDDGNDTYIYSRGDGNDTIFEAAYDGLSDRLELTDITSSEVTVSREGNDLILIIAESAVGAGDGGSIRLGDTARVGAEYGVETVAFADGIELTNAQLHELYIETSQTDGDDNFAGFTSDNVFEGGLGDDSIFGDDGNDTYIYSRGDGNDTIFEAAYDGLSDRLELTDITSSEVTVSREGNDLILIIAESAVGAGDGGSIRLGDTARVGAEYGVETVAFADGIELTNAQLHELYIETSQTDGDDNFAGFTSDNVFEGGLGDDSIFGDDGNDTYIYSRGDGNDTIFEAAYDGLSDRLELTDITSSEVTVSREGNDLILIIAESAVGAGDGGSIRLGDTARVGAEYGVETVAFADGIELTNAQLHELYIETSQTDGDDNFAGFTSDNVFEGGLGDDSIFGDDGNDTYIYSRGDGNDTIFEAAYDGLSDRLELTDITSSEVTVSREGNDLILIIAESAVGAGDGGSIRLGDTARVGAEYGVETVAFADGIELSATEMREIAVDNAAPLVSDVTLGSMEEDGQRLIMVAELLALASDANGHDLFVINLTSSSGELIDNSDGSYIFIPATNFNGPVTLSYDISDRVTSVSTTASLNVIPDPFNETSDDDFVIGTSSADTINAAEGDDVLDGLAGDDNLFGGAGNDTFIGGSGNDLMDGGYGIDTVDYSNATNRVEVSLLSGNGSSNQAQGDSYISIESIIGSNFGDALRGDNDANDFDGGNGRDVLIGFGGNDILTGGAGRDILNGGDGADFIIGGDGVDQARYNGSTEGVQINLLEGTAAGGQAEGDTLIEVENLFGSNHDDILFGDENNNQLFGHNGDDALAGNGGISKLFGGTGADSFVLSDGFAYVMDFEDNVDQLDVSAYGFTSIAEALENLDQVGNHARFRYDGDVLLVLNTDMNDLVDDIIIYNDSLML